MMEKRNQSCSMLLGGEVKTRAEICPLYLAVWRILVPLRKIVLSEMVEATARAKQIEEEEAG